MSGRALKLFGVVAAGGAGYYLYTAGGDPKVAKKEVEHDLASAKAKLKNEDISFDAAKKRGEEWATRAGQKIDHTVDDARANVNIAKDKASAKASEAEAKLHQLKNDAAATFESTRKDAGRKIDETDAKIERKAAEAKNGVSSWLGFGGK